MSGTGTTATDEELAELVRTTAEAASALIAGDVRAYATLVRHADDFTLMAPFGARRDAASTTRTRGWRSSRRSFAAATQRSRSSSPTPPPIS